MHIKSIRFSIFISVNYVISTLILEIFSETLFSFSKIRGMNKKRFPVNINGLTKCDLQ